MSHTKNWLNSAILLIVVISISGCISLYPETKESKLEKKRDELVAYKEEAEKQRRPIFDDVRETLYKSCLEKKSLREEPRDCEKEKQEQLEKDRSYIKIADDRVDRVRREIQELERSK